MIFFSGKKIIILSIFLLSIFLLQSCDTSNSAGPANIDSINIDGTVRYEDKLYNQTDGFYGTRFRPVRFAIIDVIDVNGDLLESTSSDEFGYFFITTISSADYLSIRAENSNNSNKIYINDIDGSLYAATYDLTQSEITTDLVIDINSDHAAGGAFNMLDVFQYAMQYSVVHSVNSQQFKPLSVYWRRNNSSYGTYFCDSYEASFCPRGVGLYVLGGGTQFPDTDEFDDDILLHEFGHYLENNFAIFSSPGGQHTFTDNTLDLRLSWSEGWANYVGLTIKTWLKENNPSALSLSPFDSVSSYIDTDFGGIGIYFDFINLDQGLCPQDDCYLYASNEVAVTQVLFNISVEEQGVQLIWDSISIDLSESVYPMNVETFWDSFSLRNNSIDSAKLINILLNRKINYYEDNFENNLTTDDTLNPSASVTDCTASGVCINNDSHTLYKNSNNPDKDFIALDLLSGVEYIFETVNLHNGADTYLQLFSADGNLILEDDDRDTQAFNCSAQSCPNDGINFSSEIVYTPPVSSVYYLSISTPETIYSDGYNMVGRYGSYDLLVQTQTN